GGRLRPAGAGRRRQDPRRLRVRRAPTVLSSLPPLGCPSSGPRVASIGDDDHGGVAARTDLGDRLPLQRRTRRSAPPRAAPPLLRLLRAGGQLRGPNPRVLVRACDPIDPWRPPLRRVRLHPP